MDREQVIQKIQKNREILQEFSVQKLAVFGSVLRGEAGAGSDVDILVDFEPNATIGLFEFIHLKDVLSEILGCPVDLVTRDALHPAMRDRIVKEAVHVA